MTEGKAMSELHEGNSRREFLKKAGTVAWVVPTVQVINMAAASAGVDGSVVTTTVPPSTTEAPRCYCELKISGPQVDDNGRYVFEVCVHISDGCVGADNVTVSAAGRENNYGIQDCYMVTVSPNELPTEVLVEIHDNQGTVLTTCRGMLDSRG